jgi:hypothetical protein
LSLLSSDWKPSACINQSFFFQRTSLLATACNLAPSCLHQFLASIPSWIPSFSISLFPCYFWKNYLLSLFSFLYSASCLGQSNYYSAYADMLYERKTLLIVCGNVMHCTRCCRWHQLATVFRSLQVWLRHVERIWSHQRTDVLPCGVLCVAYSLVLFSSPREPKSFQDFLSHRIMCYMHEVLNIDENKN